MTPLMARLHLQEVFQQPFAILGEDGLGMKLDAVDGEIPVAQAHDLGFVVIAKGSDLQAGWQGVALHEQGVVARGGEWLGQAFEDGLALMTDFGNFTMHEAVCPHNFTTKDVADALVPETYAKRWDAGSELLDDGTTDARLLRCTWAR